MLSNVRVGPLAIGAATLLPGATRLLRRRGSGTASAQYCYCVWLRHLVSAAALTGGRTGVPRRWGLAALLSDAAEHIALDVVRGASGPGRRRSFQRITGQSL